MKHLKKSALLLVIAVVAFGILFAFTEGLLKLLIFPIIALVAFAALYLIKQGEKDKTDNIKDGVRYTIEDQEAEQWIKHDLAPRTLSYIKHKHWPLIIYSFVFVVGVLFLWSYLTIGTDGAIQNAVFAGVLFWILVVYAFFAPSVFNLLYKTFPKKIRRYAGSDWVRGYVFLLPLTFTAYVFSPFIASGEPITVRLAGFPAFIVGYTLLFLSAASILYLHAETKKEEEKRLKKSVKEYLND